MKHLILVFVLLQTAYGKAQQIRACDSIPALNRTVIEAAKPYIGRKVGKGECWDLIKVVLDEAQADWDGFEGFGKKVNPKTDCLSPGDIVMFKGVLFEGEAADGSTYSFSMPNHYAIIMGITDDNRLLIMHQNTSDFGRKTGVSFIYPTDLKKGKITYFRPQKH